MRDNITFFDSTIPDKIILQTIQDIGLKNWFDSLPDGLDTKIISEETGLSAGEAQLLALTRAFLKQPQLVILDEASSRLDPATEHLVDTAISRLLHNRTAIIIAHRLATLHKVNDILILEKGEIIEYGAREELIHDSNSRYYQLLQTGSIMEVLK